MKRILLFLVLITCMVSMVFAAGEKEASASSAEGTEISFWNGFTASDGDILREIFDRFNAENPQDIKIDMDIMPWGNMLEKLAVSVSTKTGPTLILLGLENIPEYSQSGALLSLNDFWEWSGLDKDNYSPNVLKAFQYNNNTYGIPMQYNSHYLYWNKDLFREAGLDPETPPKNFSEFIEYAERLSDPAKEQYGYAFAADSAVITNFLWSNGGDWITADNTKSAINSPEAIQVFKMFQDFTKNKISPTGMTGADLDNLFYAGKVAMYINGPWLIAGCREKGIDFGIGSIPASDSGNKEFIGTGVAFMITSSATKEQKIAAYEVIKYWLSKDILKEWTLRNGFPAWSQEVLDDPEVQENLIQSELGTITQYTRIPFEGLPESTQILSDYVNPILEQLTYLRISPSEAAAKMEEGINKVLSNR
nr:ABC transporter substrate-binding protein [uncultured Sphaerochaeta sp.]